MPHPDEIAERPGAVRRRQPLTSDPMVLQLLRAPLATPAATPTAGAAAPPLSTTSALPLAASSAGSITPSSTPTTIGRLKQPSVAPSSIDGRDLSLDGSDLAAYGEELAGDEDDDGLLDTEEDAGVEDEDARPPQLLSRAGLRWIMTRTPFHNSVIGLVVL
ncbi:hypothetical protein HK405_000067, partial [Cladochytrium tenue]